MPEPSPPEPNFTPPVTVTLNELLEATKALGGVQLFDREGEPLPSPWVSLEQASLGLLPLDHDLTLSSEVAARLGLGALWYRVMTHEGQLEWYPTGELGHLFELLAPELETSALASCDPLGRLASVSGSAQTLLAYQADGPLRGRCLGELLGQPTGWLQRESPSVVVLDLPVERRETLTLTVHVSPFCDVTGRPSGWLVRFQAKPFLSRGSVDWKAMVEHFPGLVMRLDRAGQVLFVNRRVGSLTEGEVEGHPVFDLVRKDSRATARHFHETVIHQMTTLSGELPVHDPRRGETIWYRFTATPMRRDGDVEVLVYATDISLRVQAEQELRHSQDRIRLLTSRLNRAQEEERRRISRELHDELGGLLTALRLEVGTMEQLPELPKDARERLAGLEGMLSQTLATVRRLSTELRPQILDDLGLAAALEALLRDAARRCQFTYEFEAPRRIPGPTELHLHLYRICQEALTNICRHAQPTRVRLSLTRPFRQHLRLLVEDDGRGYTPSEERHSLGLAGIVERVQLLEGRLQIESAPGQGCRLLVEVPLHLDAPCPLPSEATGLA